MTIEKIKNNIDSKLGDNVKIIYNGSRNKKEEIVMKLLRYKSSCNFVNMQCLQLNEEFKTK